MTNMPSISAADPTMATYSSSSGRDNSSSDEFDIISAYHTLLANDPELPFPIAAVFALSDLVSQSKAATTSELMENIRSASTLLKNSLENPVPATAGLDLFTRFVVTKTWDAEDDFEAHKASLSSLAREFAIHTVPSCREKICQLVLPFIKDDSIILTHSYSRVVMQVLLSAAIHQRKRISVYVTESRPTGLGLRTYEQCIANQIPCTIILDSAVAYIMPKVDLCLTGAEGVVESGGFLNAVGTYGLAIIAKSMNKPFFTLAESFKFLRMFPLNQYDFLPNNKNVLPFPEISSEQSSELKKTLKPVKATKIVDDDEDDEEKRIDNQDQHRIPSPTTSPTHTQNAAPSRKSNKLMSKEMERLNPAIDYTTPDLVSFLFSDVGVLTPSGVGDALLAVYGGAD